MRERDRQSAKGSMTSFEEDDKPTAKTCQSDPRLMNLSLLFVGIKDKKVALERRPNRHGAEFVLARTILHLHAHFCNELHFARFCTVMHGHAPALQLARWRLPCHTIAKYGSMEEIYMM